MKIGLFGGTFDPIHNAHLLIAQHILDELGLNKIIFVPASVPPHKETTSPANIRLEMVEAAITDNPYFEFSNIEIERKGKSFSYDTICAMKSHYQLKNEELFCIIGSDNLAEFHTWHKPNEILETCTVVVFPRKGHDKNTIDPNLLKKVIYLEDAPLMEISSSDIRSRVKKGLSIDYYLPDIVKEIVHRRSLYR